MIPRIIDALQAPPFHHAIGADELAYLLDVPPATVRTDCPRPGVDALRPGWPLALFGMTSPATGRRHTNWGFVGYPFAICTSANEAFPDGVVAHLGLLPSETGLAIGTSLADLAAAAEILRPLIDWPTHVGSLDEGLAFRCRRVLREAGFFAVPTLVEGRTLTFLVRQRVHA